MTTAKSITVSTWPVLVFALVVLGAGLWAMAALAEKDSVTAAAITALATAVLGVVGTHVGHVAGHELATRGAVTEALPTSLERLAQLHTNKKLTDEEFAAAKQRVLG